MAVAVQGLGRGPGERHVSAQFCALISNSLSSWMQRRSISPTRRHKGSQYAFVAIVDREMRQNKMKKKNLKRLLYSTTFVSDPCRPDDFIRALAAFSPATCLTSNGRK